MRTKYQVVLLALLAVGLLTVPIAANAGTNLGMSLNSGSTDTLCDNNIDFTGCTHNASDQNSSLGAIVFIGSVGNWTTNVTSGLGPPTLGLPGLLDLTNVSMSTASGGSPMNLLLTVTGMTGSIASVLNSIGGTNSVAGTTITITSWLSSANTAFCHTAACGTQMTTQTLSGLSWNSTVAGNNTTPGGPYSVTLAITIDSHGQADLTSFDDYLSIPEPATLSILGAGLLALGTGLRKKLLRG
jgi:hypothetical protein